MRLVILDGYALNPGDLSWQEVESLAEVTRHDRTPAAQVAGRLRDADAVLSNKVHIGADVFAACPKLKYVGVMATGYNIVDLAAAKKAGVTVTNVPGYSTNSVAQVVFALLLEITHHTGHHAARVAEGAWTRCPDFSFWDFPLLELKDLTIGIVGFGEIGQAVGRIAHAFGMKVIYNTRTKKPFDEFPAEYVALPELFRRADVVTLHCPLTPQNRGLVSWPLLQTMKPSAILINTARGPLINEADVARALREKVIAAAGLDVLSEEPPPADNPLLAAPNCFILPHVGWASVAARQRLMHEIAENLRAYAAGKPRNVVS
ncbi:MAG TPA: D-2-hydroxyacid dehydrogenase [Candidatus Methylacidiphilales bacterium]|jgi:glycerate dehydrogenase|nr:D-2-hydroxyacid dehydrogenase [Candidatus Methylacidiphilales bacterium]